MFKKNGKTRKVGLFTHVNQTNSNMGVQCVEPNPCMLRHTDTCNRCANNIGPKRDECYFVPRED